MHRVIQRYLLGYRCGANSEKFEEDERHCDKRCEGHRLDAEVAIVAITGAHFLPPPEPGTLIAAVVVRLVVPSAGPDDTVIWWHCKVQSH